MRNSAPVARASTAAYGHRGLPCKAPVNKGMTFLSAMASSAYNPAKTYHNKWFLDNVQPGTKVLFAFGVCEAK